MLPPSLVLCQRGLMFALMCFLASSALASSSTSVRNIESSAQQQAIQIQQQLEQLDTQRRQDFEAWRQARRQLLLLEAHNERQAAWNARLAEEVQSLQEQLDGLDATREELEPLMLAMLERLEGFIRHDLPFQRETRLHRVREIRALMQRVDVSHAEKLRHLLTTYRQEVEQGRLLAVSREFIRPSAAAEERVTLLRVGRIGLYYLSEDQQRAGVWSATTQTWQPLNATQRAQVQAGLSMAEERGLPQFLDLPLSVPLRETTGQGEAE